MYTRCLAILGTIVASLVFFLILLCDQSQLDIAYLYPAYKHFLLFNSKPQVHAHMGMVLSIVILGFFSAWGGISAERLRRCGPACVRWVHSLERLYPFLLVCISFFCFFARFKTGRDKWVFSFAMTMAIVILPRFFPRLRAYGGRLFACIAGLAALAAVALTIWHPAVLPDWSVSHDAHVGCIMTPINQVTAGLNFGKEIFCAYGILLPAVLGWLQKLTGWWTAGQQFTLFYVIDLLYLGLSVWAWRIWNRRHVGYLVAAFLLVFPFLFSYEYMEMMNHSSLRFFNFALIPLLVLLVRNLPGQNLMLGVLTGIGLAVNMETGIALGCGMLAYGLTVYPPRHIHKMAVALLVWMSAAVATLLLVSLLYGGIRVFIDSFMYISAFSQGFAGHPLKPYPLFLFMSVHVVYTIFRCFLVWRRGPLSQRQRFRFFVSATFLLWMAYQMGRPAEIRTETFYSLYAFLLMDALDVRRLRLFWRTPFHWKKLRLSLSLCVVLVAFIPTGSYLTIKTIESYKHAVPCDGMVELSGITVPKKTADLLRGKIEYLNETKHDDVLVLSGFSYTIPLVTQYYPKNSFMNMFMESVLVSAYQENVRRILTSSPKLIYFDATVGGLEEGELQFYQQLREDISSGYALSNVVAGWEIWELRTP